MDVDQALEWTVEKFVSRNRIGVCLLSSALLVHRLRKGIVVEGYQIFNHDKTYVRHYWVRIDNRDVDAGTEVNKRLLSYPNLSTQLVEVKPGDDYLYLCALDPQRLRELEEGYKLYLRNPKAHWKLVGTRLGWLRRLVLSQNT